ncbi:MAG TPA: response regulator [Lacunisphaera sp.]
MKRILHIDDEADIREVLGAYLQCEGYEVVSVASPTEAFQAIQQAKPDLVICDLQLDESDGLQTIDRLRVMLPDVPAILLTGVLLDPHVAQATVQKRNLVYLEKTQPLQRILGEIRRLLA